MLAGNSLGAAVALAAVSPRIAARALISLAGIVRLSIDPVLALASAQWLLHPYPGTLAACSGYSPQPGPRG